MLLDESAQPICIDPEKPEGAVVVFRDVGEERRLDAQAAVSARLAALGTLAAGIAHEFNNPLTYSLANQSYAIEELESMRRDLSSRLELGGPRMPMVRQIEEIEAALHEARDGAERIRNIVAELRLFANPGLRRAPLSLARVVRSGLAICGRDVRRRAMLVESIMPTPDIYGDEALLVQVLVNLLLNAVQAIPEASTRREVRLATEIGCRNEPTLTVADTGCGIPAAERQRIFDPFFTTKPVGQGVGLGLSVCHRIIEAHGGRFEVDSVLGQGTTFRAVFPPCGFAPRGLDGSASSIL